MKFFSLTSVVRLGMGVQVDKVTFTSTELIAALDKVLHEPRHDLFCLIERSCFSYKVKTQQIAKMMADKPEKAKQSFAEWAEFAASNPGLHEVRIFLCKKDSSFRC